MYDVVVLGAVPHVSDTRRATA